METSYTYCFLPKPEDIFLSQYMKTYLTRALNRPPYKRGKVSLYGYYLTLNS